MPPSAYQALDQSVLPSEECYEYSYVGSLYSWKLDFLIWKILWTLAVTLFMAVGTRPRVWDFEMFV
jgi:hypothetical protein